MTAETNRGQAASDPTDEELAEALLGVLDELADLEASVVERLADGPDPDAYLAWARSTFPDLAPTLFAAAEEPSAKVACWLARELWNVMPVEANGFEPVSMPEPDSGAPCPCQSGRTFQACCRGFSVEMPIFPDSLWPALAESRPSAHWLRLARAGALPDVGIIYVAQCFHEAEEWENVVDLLAPRVAGGDLAPDLCMEAMELLGSSYKELDRAKDEGAMLRRFTAHADEFVRCVANRRLAMILHAQGHRDRAWRHFRTAAQAAPDDPATALQELVLLTEEGRHRDAEDRAADWLVHLSEAGTEPDDRLLQLIEDFENDAQYGRDQYFRWQLPPEWLELVDWIDGPVDLPTPTSAWRLMQGSDNDDLLREAHVPDAPAEISALEEQWRGLGDGSPYADEEMLDLDIRAFWLQEHPEAADSFVILADVAEYLREYEDLLGGPDNRWYEAILRRGADMLDKAWPDDRDGTVPWVVGDNRPPLSLLADYIDLLDAGDDLFEDLMVLYLRLNPNDNHGIRTDLINLLLGDGRDTEALELGQRYGDDMFAETRYGVGLALYRLGREDEAADAVAAAVEDLPLVLKYLLRNRIDEPAADEHGLLVGGEYQAWLYREAMRETWLAVPGMYDWLKQFVEQAQAALRAQRSRRRR